MHESSILPEMTTTNDTLPSQSETEPSAKAQAQNLDDILLNYLLSARNK
jgi:hypothetical protein